MLKQYKFKRPNPKQDKVIKVQSDEIIIVHSGSEEVSLDDLVRRDHNKGFDKLLLALY